MSSKSTNFMKVYKYITLFFSYFVKLLSKVGLYIEKINKIYEDTNKKKTNIPNCIIYLHIFYCMNKFCVYFLNNPIFDNSFLKKLIYIYFMKIYFYKVV